MVEPAICLVSGVLKPPKPKEPHTKMKRFATLMLAISFLSLSAFADDHKKKDEHKKEEKKKKKEH
jgi:hypothetical protein